MGFFFKSIVKTPGEQILLVVDSTNTQVMQSNIHRDSDLPRCLKKKILVDFFKIRIVTFKEEKKSLDVPIRR